MITPPYERTSGTVLVSLIAAVVLTIGLPGLGLASSSGFSTRSTFTQNHLSGPTEPPESTNGAQAHPNYHYLLSGLSMDSNDSNPTDCEYDVDGCLNWLAFDPIDGNFWIANSNLRSVQEVAVDPEPTNYASYTLVANLSVGVDPFGVAVDTENGEIFVTNSGSNDVTVISSQNNTSITSIPVGSTPTGIAYDSSNGEVYVADSGSNSLSILSGTTLELLGTIEVGHYPIGVAFDPATDRIFVANDRGYTVTVLSGATNTVLATIPAGVGPYGVAIDSATDNVYVTNQGSSNVSVISAPMGEEIGSIAIVIGDGELQGIAFDPRSGYLYAGDGDAALIQIAPSSVQQVSAFSVDPSGVAVDPVSGTICFSDSFNGTLGCIQNVTILNSANCTYTIEFIESGLPTPGWGVTVYDGPGSTAYSDSIDLSFCNVAIAGLTVVFPPVGPFIAYPAAISFRGYNTGPNFVTTFEPGPPEYPITIQPVGLPADAGWYATIGGVTRDSSGGPITFLEPNGTYQLYANSSTNLTPPIPESIDVTGESQSISENFGPVQIVGSTVFPLSIWETSFGGIPLWGWILGTAIIIAAVAIYVIQGRPPTAPRYKIPEA
jgi:YVTN family beta-propeller protein